jgi:DNA modification methylase
MINIIQGDALTELKRLPDSSVQCCVTSPPYWGLRDYKVEPQIWDAENNCDHKWSNKIPPRGRSGWNTFQHKYQSAGCHKTTIGAKLKKEPEIIPGHGQFCKTCGAWRGSLGLEPEPELYVKHIKNIFIEVKRVLKKNGILWLNLGDSYADSKVGRDDQQKFYDKSHGYKCKTVEGVSKRKLPGGFKPKDLCGIPWRVAFALQSAGWYLRSDIIWFKPNAMPESVKDRPTKSHEYLFLLSKSRKYYYDWEAIKEPYSENSDMDYRCQLRRGKKYDIKFEGHRQQGLYKQEIGDGKNRRSVWSINTRPFHDEHYAVFPDELPELCILAGSKPGDTIIDPFSGSGTTGKVALKLGRQYIAIELSPKSVKLHDRIKQVGLC